MNTTAIVMEALLKPIITDPTRRQFSARVNAELWPLKWDEKTKTLGCIARFSSSFHMPEHLLWHREAISAALDTMRHVKTNIATPGVKEHLVYCGQYQQYVELEVYYFQDFLTFPSPDSAVKLEAEFKADV